MSTTTTSVDDQLVQIRRRIDRLAAHAHADSPRVWRHLDALRQAEDAVLAALREDAPDEVDESLAQLKMRLDIAEHSLEADAAEDWASFAAAVEAELHGWDTYLERLQASAVAEAWKRRERTEAAIGDLRDRRIAAGERLAQAHDGSAAARKHITAARNDLDKRAAELSTTFNTKE
jgi:hypothetical protein